MSGITLRTEGLPNPSFALDLVAYSSPPKMLNLDFSLSYCWKLCTTLLVELLLWNKVCFLLTALKFTFSPLSLKFSWFVSRGLLSWGVERPLWGLWSAEEGARVFWSVALFSDLDPDFISLISCLVFGFVHYVSPFIFKYSILFSRDCWILWCSQDNWVDKEGELFIFRDFLISMLNLVNSTCTVKQPCIYLR